MSDPFKFKTNLNQPKASRGLEWEESIQDFASPVEGFSGRERPAESLQWLRVVIIICAGLLLIKLFNLQIVNGNRLRQTAEGNRIRNQIIPAPRGLIYDRNNELLAGNEASFNLIVTPLDLPKQTEADEVNKLIDLLKLDEAAVKDSLKNLDAKSFQPVVVAQNISPDQTILFKTHEAEFAGFSINPVPVRQYTNAVVFSHVLGYTGLISEAELNQLDHSIYTLTDAIGKSGIELAYEKYLKGQNGGNQLEGDAFNKPVKVLGTVEPDTGNNLYLNIDKGLQEQLYNSFQQHAPRGKGAVVALNPGSGEVLTLLSLPGYDNNLFARGISGELYQNYLGDKALPLFNRALSGTYPSGSTIKLAEAVAGLQEQVIDENTVIVDRGSIVIPNQFDPTKSAIFYGWKREGLGAMTVRSAIAQSSDIFFYTVGGGAPNSEVSGLGPERLASYYRKFGMGSTTGIDIAGEKPGLVADPEWKAQYYKDDKILSKWYLGDTYHIAIGQGDMLVTPLQVAEWTSVIANGGTAYKPTILRNVTDSTGKTVYRPQPQILIQKFASDQNIRIVQEGMELAVKSGTARSLASLPVCSAGKTGTSQFDDSDPKRTHAWFTVYAPCDHPQIVITVLVEAGGEGNAVALPIAKDALQWWVKNRLGK